MKKIKKWLKDIFDPGEFNELDVAAIGEAFNDPSVRSFWLASVLDDLKRMNLEVDRRLLTGNQLNLIDLCARRQAVQDLLQRVLSAKRQAMQDVRPNPRPQGFVNLDRVTA